LVILRDSRKSRQKSGKNTAYFEKNCEKHGKNTASKYDVFSIATHLQCPFLSHW